MPQPCQISPLPCTKHLGKGARHFRYILQMFFKFLPFFRRAAFFSMGVIFFCHESN